jgi:mycobactin phenyloxazoline synthetase
MNHTPDLSQLQQEILAVVGTKLAAGLSHISADTHLIEAGLNSISLMSLMSHWRAQGYAVSFAELAKDPRASTWALQLQKSANAADSQQSFQLDPASIGERPHASFPLAPMQFAYWLGRDHNQPLGGVSAHLYTEFQLSPAAENGQLDAERLSVALEKLLQRHGCLRLKVHSDGQQSHQPADSVNAQVRLHDLRQKSAAEAEQLLQQYRHTYSSQMLDIEHGEVFSLALSLLPDSSCRLHLDVDMIAADAVSYRILLRELAMLYQDPAQQLPTLPLSYKDCRKALECNWSKVQHSSGAWWQQRLADLPDGPVLPLKASFGDQPVTTRRHLQFDAELKNALYTQCQKQGLTPSVVLATVLAETLAGWSKNPRFLLNVPLFQRPLDGPDVSGVIGDFSSSILLDIDTAPRQSFTERARQVQFRMHEDAAHADYGGVHVLRDLGRARGRQVTAPIVFTSALNLGELFDANVRQLFGDPIWIISQGPQVLLDAQVTELDGGILINWDCREDAFVDGVLDAMFEFFRASVLKLATQPASWAENAANLLPANRTMAEHQPAVTVAASPEKTQHPKTAMERTVAAVWTEVIGGDGLDIHQDLFAAGGDSVLATTLISQLREVFGEDAIDMRMLFTAPTIAGIAEAISRGNAHETKLQIAEVYCEILDLDDEPVLEMES